MRWMTLTAVLASGISLAGEELTRAGQIAAERDQKEQKLKAETPSQIEQRLNWVRDAGLLERVGVGYHGLRIKMGGLAPGGGFGAGPEFSRDGLAGGRLSFRAGAQGSTRGYQKQDLHMGFVQNRVSFDFYAVHHNYPSLNFYGSGPDSSREGRSNYRHEDMAIDGTVTVELFPRLRAGGSIGYVLNNVGPGTDSRFISAEQIYDVPGIHQQTNFSRLGAFIQYDYRDFAPGPRSGGNYMAQFHRYSDRTLRQYDFTWLDLEAQQYIPLFNKKRVIALRAKSVTTFTGNGQ